MLYPPIKKLGQNFLIDTNVSTQMVSLLNLSPDDTVIEIGAGLGALTEKLAQQLVDPMSKIYAIEIDHRLIKKLETMFLANLNLKVVETDILNWLPTFEYKKEFKILGSLPFYITSPIIHSIIKMPKQPKICVLLIQKEVAQKICAKTDKASYMSTFVQTFFDTELIDIVTRDKFDPTPKVDGAIIRMEVKTAVGAYSYTPQQIAKYEGFLHKGFSNPRKMLNKIFTKEELDKANLDGSLRAQNIPPYKWVQAYCQIVNT
jgi:16S rRNA (adenine1518-N6/adenine1519-N6)-dimethyltransferase